MTRYAALLRGINVGGNKKVPMADLRALLTGFGYTDVRTHLNSGNAVFDTKTQPEERIAGRIEDGLQAELGVQARCLIRDATEFSAVAATNPLAEIATNGSRMMVLFLSARPDPALLAAHDPTELAPEHVRLGDRVIYQWCPDGVLAAPPVGGFVERYWQVAVTARNWNTVSKLRALLTG